MSTPLPFENRRAAGVALGRALARYRDAAPLVVGLPRGGVPVAFEVARALGGTLDVLLVRKLGAPRQPELALGSIVDANPPQVVWNNDIISALHPGDDYLRDEQRRQQQELARRRTLYRSGAAPLSATHRTVIVVDDGVATGSTMKAALLALRNLGAARLIAASPVAPRAVWASISQLADAATCIAQLDAFSAVALYYADFEQTSDDEVVELLAQARNRRNNGAPAHRNWLLRCSSTFAAANRRRDSEGAPSLRQNYPRYPMRVPLSMELRVSSRRILRPLLAALLAAGTGIASAAKGQANLPPPNSMEARVAACAACHGDQGQGTDNDYFPRLAGKPAEYLYNQLVNFRDGHRKYPPMNYLVTYLSDDYLRKIAEYFSNQRPPYPAPSQPTVSASTLARGKQLVLNGDPAKNVPACAACHGKTLTGMEPAIPGLLGLHADYISAQLGAWRSGVRQATAPDCMHTVSTRLSDDDIAALANWLSTQAAPANPVPAPARSLKLPLQCGSGQQ
ncbi:hypothetical protein DFQ30_001364 [Apophysomyces sp. BC1015]|nr:hypothetical protein DFQ30_001364 [Apophysomyces sp. BC1015]